MQLVWYALRVAILYIKVNLDLIKLLNLFSRQFTFIYKNILWVKKFKTFTNGLHPKKCVKSEKANFF